MCEIVGGNHGNKSVSGIDGLVHQIFVSSPSASTSVSLAGATDGQEAFYETPLNAGCII
jgi:hypothetical protein